MERAGRWGAFEIKLSEGAIEEGAENLKDIDALIRDDPTGRPLEFLAVICGMSFCFIRRRLCCADDLAGSVMDLT